MKHHLSALSSLFLSTLLPVHAQSLSPAEQKIIEDLKPAQTIILEKDDSAALRQAKAAMVVPSAQQMAWQELEFTTFIHFGINTFTGREWGSGKETPETFNPTKVDTDQWCRTAKAAGMKMIIITLKHHDGFCLWQTRYNDDFSVKKSPWKQGKGDVMKLLAASCKKYGLKIGVYLSPADLYQMENAKGIYGNRSAYRESTIPTDPKHFHTNPLKGRPAPSGKPTFQFKVDDYNRYMLNQLYECLTEYGTIDEVWFDGAHPKRKGNQQYTEELWFKMIHELVPDAVIACGGKDVRWCGNEAGRARQVEWASVPLVGDPAVRKTWKYVPGVTHNTAVQGSAKELTKADFVRWWPSEVDTSIRHGWFWRDESQHVRSAEEIYNIYESSIGSNGLLLLNIPPNRDGVFAAHDTAVLEKVGKRIQATYGKAATRLTADKQGIYHFAKPTTINRIAIQEDIATHGQRVIEHALDVWIDGQWQEIATAPTIGYKRIHRTADITTDKIRLRILKQRLRAKISQVNVYYDLAPLTTPSITRNRQGTVSIEGAGSIHYTLDGSEPTAKSPLYLQALSLPAGGTVRAIALRDKEKSEIATQYFDLSKAKWKIHSVSSENPSSRESAAMAIDENPKTIWHSRWSGGTDALPHSITIDFGEALTLKGASYLPRPNEAKGGIVDQYLIELSRDGKKWHKASEGRFDNIENDPTLRNIRFEKTFTDMRYLRFIGKHSIEGKDHSSAAEIGVLTR